MNSYLKAIKEALKQGDYKRWEPYVTDAAVVVQDALIARSKGNESLAVELESALRSTLSSIDMDVRRQVKAALKDVVGKAFKGVLQALV